MKLQIKFSDEGEVLVREWGYKETKKEKTSHKRTLNTNFFLLNICTQ